MEIEIRPYQKKDIPSMTRIWNEAVAEGIHLTQCESFTEKEAAEFFREQTCTCIASDRSTGVIVGIYILHPDAEGRRSHIANASCVVWSLMRHKGIGRQLVLHSLKQAKKSGFRILQLSSVVSTDTPARRLYTSLGFKEIGVLPEGYKTDSGKFLDIVSYYRELSDIQ